MAAGPGDAHARRDGSRRLLHSTGKRSRSVPQVLPRRCEREGGYGTALGGGNKMSRLTLTVDPDAVKEYLRIFGYLKENAARQKYPTSRAAGGT